MRHRTKMFPLAQMLIFSSGPFTGYPRDCHGYQATSRAYSGQAFGFIQHYLIYLVVLMSYPDTASYLQQSTSTHVHDRHARSPSSLQSMPDSYAPSSHKPQFPPSTNVSSLSLDQHCNAQPTALTADVFKIADALRIVDALRFVDALTLRVAGALRDTPRQELAAINQLPNVPAPEKNLRVHPFMPPPHGQECLVWGLMELPHRNPFILQKMIEASPPEAAAYPSLRLGSARKQRDESDGRVASVAAVSSNSDQSSTKHK
ncbi:hypothetical protein JOM56_012242 [Amanita muscaria]